MLFHPWEKSKNWDTQSLEICQTLGERKKMRASFFSSPHSPNFRFPPIFVSRSVGPCQKWPFLPSFRYWVHARTHTRTHAVKRLWLSVPFVFPVRFSFLFPIFYPRPISSVDLRPVIGKTDKLTLEDAAFFFFLFSCNTHTHTYERNLPFSITWRSFRLGFPHFVKCCVRCKWKQKKEQKEILYGEGGAGFNEQIFFFSPLKDATGAHTSRLKNMRIFMGSLQWIPNSLLQTLEWAESSLWSRNSRCF